MADVRKDHSELSQKLKYSKQDTSFLHHNIFVVNTYCAFVAYGCSLDISWIYRKVALVNSCNSVSVGLLECSFDHGGGFMQVSRYRADDAGIRSMDTERKPIQAIDQKARWDGAHVAMQVGVFLQVQTPPFTILQNTKRLQFHNPVERLSQLPKDNWSFFQNQSEILSLIR